MNYVDRAEHVMRELGEKPKKPRRSDEFLTTSKIRSILSYVSEIYNDENLSQDNQLSEKSVNKIQAMRVRVIYEAGREQSVRKFVDKAGILEEIKGIGNSRERFINFAKYMEALVAYHRYLGGND
ncbi:MAG: type III-A CRISPR-associated protein Csm2 [Anaerovoracaceae bacterium]